MFTGWMTRAICGNINWLLYGNSGVVLGICGGKTMLTIARRGNKGVQVIFIRLTKA